MAERKQTKTFDTVIIAACLLLLIACAFILSNGSFFSGEDDTSKLKAVGQIASRSNDVRRRHHDDLSWNPANKSDTVYEGDSVYTGDTSKADISLATGGKLTLDPKSMVVIKTEGNNLSLDLKYGAFGGKVTGDQKIIVINNGERSEFTGHNAQVRIEQKKGERAKVRVISGELKIKEKSGEEKIVKKDEEVAIEKQTKEQEAADKLAREAEKAAAALAEKQAAQAAREAALATERAQQLEREKEIAKTAPIPIYPAQNQLFLTSKTIKGRTISFSWDDHLPRNDYALEISKTPDFGNAVVSQSLESRSFATDKLDGGSYYWRVRARNPGHDAVAWSLAVPFQVLERAALKAPSLRTAAAPFVIPFALVDLKKVDPKQTSVQSGSNPTLTWAPNPAAISYDLQVTTTSHFSPEQVTDVGTETSYQIKDLRPGIYSYRVRAHLPAGQTSETSATAVLKVQLPAPHLSKPASTITSYKIGWSPLLFAAAYEVQVSPDLSFKTHKAMLSKSGNNVIFKSLYAKDGGLHWRVRALNADRVPLSDFSEPQTLREQALIQLTKKTETVLRSPASDDANADASMMVPQLVEPRPNTSVLAMSQSSAGYISFKWKAQQDPNSTYRLEVSQSPDFKNPVVARSTSATSAVVIQRFPAGQMYWRVRQESPRGHSRWANPNALSVTPE